MTAAAPSGVVTFLFTDVEGSTRRWEADADGMRVALVVHDKVLRTAIEAHDGFLFSHTGDGFVAAFASPMSAVNAAIDAQRELQLPVRMGLATGEAELRDGDYFGTVLNRAARVMAAGHGGQILLAESTAGLLSGVDLLDLGPRRLRDVPTPVGVFQVRAPGLRVEFPPLRALDTSPGNLRPATTSFIGRESEVTQVQAAVRAHRLLTLTGVGGVGKTRLALEVAAQLADEFPDGVWVFELAAVADPAAVPDAVAAVLGITQQPGKSVSESVAAALEGRVRLLVFDNCEHVLDAVADLIEAILAQSATVRIVATSREGLGVADEQVWPVPSLDLSGGIDSSAFNLFVERARSVAAYVSVAKPEEGTAVVEICRRLDGIPLAIELAASRMASMTVTEVRDRLDQRFRLLIGSRRGVERHQTLRQTVAWSYDHLDEAEKDLLVRCSVFAGGFDLQSACAVAGSDDPEAFAVLDVLDALVRKSLLVADRSAERTRFSMLETIRQFAEEQLAASGAATETGQRMPATSQSAKPTSWRCGTAPASARPTNGSPPSWPTYVPRFAGLPTTKISMWPPLSQATRGFSARGSRIMSRSAGPRNSSNPRVRPIIPGSRPYSRRSASWRGGSTMPSATATTARSFLGGAALCCRMAAKVSLEMRTCISVSPIGGPRYAVPSCNAAMTPR